jgi:hypothetical protein
LLAEPSRIVVVWVFQKDSPQNGYSPGPFHVEITWHLKSYEHYEQTGEGPTFVPAAWKNVSNA